MDAAEGGAEGGAARARRSLSFTRRAPQARAEGAAAAPPVRRSLSFTTADVRRRAFGERESAGRESAGATPAAPSRAIAQRSLSFTTGLRRRAFGEREAAPAPAPAPVTPPRPIGLQPVAGRLPPTPEQRARAAADLKAP